MLRQKRWLCRLHLVLEQPAICHWHSATLAARHHPRAHTLTAHACHTPPQDGKGNTALHILVQSWQDSKALPGGKTDGKTELYTAAGKALLEGGATPSRRWRLHARTRAGLVTVARVGHVRCEKPAKARGRRTVQAVHCLARCLPQALTPGR